ncbi:MAG: hypothetical protein ACKV22_09690 [Bryobacteraceae bacterium]
MLPPTATPYYPWYATVSGDEIEQGDIVDACPVCSPRIADIDDPNTRAQFERAERDVIVMSQSCDLVNTHARNFIDCIRSRKLPNADIELGHVSTALCHLGNIVARTGRAIKFDGMKESIAGDAEANRYIAREYRQHWSTPKGS